MRGYTVYRLDCRTGRKESIGSILERREKERPTEKNLLCLLEEARRYFGPGHEETIGIDLDVAEDALETGSMAISRGVVTVISR